MLRQIDHYIDHYNKEIACAHCHYDQETNNYRKFRLI